MDLDQEATQFQWTHPAHAGFTPTPLDVDVVLAILQSRRLPPELALRVLEFACYEPRLCRYRGRVVTYKADSYVNPGHEPSIAGLYLSLPEVLAEGIPSGATFRAKSITFRLRAADQGWATFGGQGTFNNSHTWFEASILRPTGERAARDYTVPLEDKVLEARSIEQVGDRLRELGWEMVEHQGRHSWFVHTNITAQARYKDYSVHWVRNAVEPVPQEPRVMGDGAGFLEAIHPGDRVVLWALAEVSNFIIPSDHCS